MNVYEWFWMIRNNHVMDNPFSTFWWIEIKNLFSTDGYPMMIMTKFKKIQSNFRHMQCPNFEVWNLNVSKKISRNSRIFRNMKFRDYSNQDFFHRGKKLATACGEHKLYWFRFNLYAVIFGWKNWLEKYRLILRWCDF